MLNRGDYDIDNCTELFGMDLTILQQRHQQLISLPETQTLSNIPERFVDILVLIHSKHRIYTSTRFFGNTSRVCVLDFIGAKDYFISELGTVWNRNHIFPNKNKILTKGYLPMNVLDYKYPYPWVYIPTFWETTGTWVPVNLLLGWAFHPVSTIMKLYAVSQLDSAETLSAANVYWYDQPDTVQIQQILPSRYLEFVEFLYQTKQ